MEYVTAILKISILLKLVFSTSGMKIGTYRIRESIPRMLSQAFEKQQLDGAVRSVHAI